MKTPRHSYAFIDGSFNPATGIYGCGGFLIDQLKKKHVIQASGSKEEWAKMRNVAGEVLGSMEVIKLARKLKMEKVTVYHDYEGISKWVTGEWEAKKKPTRQYREFAKAAIAGGLDICFKHVFGHSGIAGNEEADRLAKEAVGVA